MLIESHTPQSHIYHIWLLHLCASLFDEIHSRSAIHQHDDAGMLACMGMLLPQPRSHSHTRVIVINKKKKKTCLACVVFVCVCVCGAQSAVNCCFHIFHIHILDTHIRVLYNTAIVPPIRCVYKWSAISLVAWHFGQAVGIFNFFFFFGIYLFTFVFPQTEYSTSSYTCVWNATTHSKSILNVLKFFGFVQFIFFLDHI